MVVVGLEVLMVLVTMDMGLNTVEAEAAELVTVANHQAVGLCTVQVAAVAEATGRAALLGQAQEVHGELILLALAGQLELSIQAI